MPPSPAHRSLFKPSRNLSILVPVTTSLIARRSLFTAFLLCTSFQGSVGGEATALFPGCFGNVTQVPEKAPQHAGTEGVTYASCEYCPQPSYPKGQKRAKVIVLLRVFVTEEGKAKTIQAVSSVEQAFAEAAADAVRNWRFRPSQKDGKPVPAWNTVEISFRLAGPAEFLITPLERVVHFGAADQLPLKGPRNGDVIAEVFVNDGGRAGEVNVISASHKDLIPLALKAVRAWHFKKPVDSSGKPTSVWVTIEIPFKADWPAPH